MKVLRVGIIGYGDVFINHYQAIIDNPHAKLIAISSLETINQLDVNYYHNYLEMLDCETLDVVHILTPHYLHIEHILAVVKRGIHCLVEKPLIINLADYSKLVEAQALSNVKIANVFQNRYNPTIKTLKTLLDSGEYGTIRGIKGLLTWHRDELYYQSKPWRKSLSQAGSGVLMNQAIHTIDLIQYFGGAIKSIKATIANIGNLDIEVEDTAVINFNFANGSTGLLFATNTYVDNSSIEFEVITTKAIFNIKNHQLMLNQQTLITSDPLPQNSKIYYGLSHQHVINEFYEAIINNTTNYLSIHEAIKAVKIIESAKIAAKLQTTVSF